MAADNSAVNKGMKLAKNAAAVGPAPLTPSPQIGRAHLALPI